ncbi:MAG: hypothetical protein GY820_24355 [Gammaproteobacteria bacterium]|nr:hypothetical protein [Gammaproteobacteria bacterium]
MGEKAAESDELALVEAEEERGKDVAEKFVRKFLKIFCEGEYIYVTSIELVLSLYMPTF